MYLGEKKKKKLGNNDPSGQNSSSAGIISMEINEDILILYTLKVST